MPGESDAVGGVAKDKVHESPAVEAGFLECFVMVENVGSCGKQGGEGSVDMGVVDVGMDVGVAVLLDMARETQGGEGRESLVFDEGEVMDGESFSLGFLSKRPELGGDAEDVVGAGGVAGEPEDEFFGTADGEAHEDVGDFGHGS